MSSPVELPVLSPMTGPTPDDTENTDIDQDDDCRLYNIYI